VVVALLLLLLLLRLRLLLPQASCSFHADCLLSQR
jgi:hypothetical protein